MTKLIIGFEKMFSKKVRWVVIALSRMICSRVKGKTKVPFSPGELTHCTNDPCPILLRDLSLVFTSEGTGVGVGVVIRSVELYNLVKAVF